MSDKYKVVNHSLCPIKDKLDVIELEETTEVKIRNIFPRNEIIGPLVGVQTFVSK